MDLKQLHGRIIDSCKKMKECDKFKNLEIPDMSISDNIGLIFFDFLTILPIRYDVSKLREAYKDYLHLFLNTNLPDNEIEIIVERYNLDVTKKENKAFYYQDNQNFLSLYKFANKGTISGYKKQICELIFNYKINEFKKNYQENILNIFNIGFYDKKLDQILLHEFYFSQIFDFQMYDDFDLMLDCKTNTITVRDKLMYKTYDNISKEFEIFKKSLKNKLSNKNSAFYMNVGIKYSNGTSYALMCIFNNDNDSKSFKILDPNPLTKDIHKSQCDQQTLFNKFAGIMDIKYNGFISDEYADLKIDMYVNTIYSKEERNLAHVFNAGCNKDTKGMCMFWADYFVKILYMNPKFNPSDIQYIMSNIPTTMRELVILWINSEITNYLFNTEYIKLIDLFYNLSGNHNTISFNYLLIDNKRYVFPAPDPAKFIYQIKNYKNEIIERMKNKIRNKSKGYETRHNYSEQLQKMIDGIGNIDHIYSNFVTNCKTEFKSVLKDFMCYTEHNVLLRDLKEQIYNKRLLIKDLQQT